MNPFDGHSMPGAATSFSDVHRCDETRKLFAEEQLQYLDSVSAARCQGLLGHGDIYGEWQTPESLIGRRLTKSLAVISMRKRLDQHIPEELPRNAYFGTLLDEGVLTMTRYALLSRMGPSSFLKNQGFRSLDPTTIVYELYNYLPVIIAQGIQRRLEDSRHGEGLVRYLSSEDLYDMRKHKYLGVILRRMEMLSTRGLWNDIQVIANIGKNTNPKGGESPRPKEESSNPYLPLPDEYMAKMGGRVLWIVRDLGPNLIALAEALSEFGINCFKGQMFKVRLQRYLTLNVFRDRDGRPIIQPPFRFEFGNLQGTDWLLRENVRDNHEWPPRNWLDIQALMVTLQSSQLWIALLAMAGRVQEVLTLRRDCIEPCHNGETNVTGKTYKLSKNLAGEARKWPAPAILVDALAQQVQLVRACEKIERMRDGIDEDSEIVQAESEHLWASLGTGANARADEQLKDVNHALNKLAKRLGMEPRPSGRKLHSHRFRKTIARLAALAIVDSPRVLMQLFGHRDIAMTLHYILTDKALQLEIERIAQELRIMRCHDVIEDIHTSMHSVGAPSFGGHGGGAAPHMVESIKTQEEQLYRQGRLWDADSAYDLAAILTNNGQYFRLVKPGVLCTKPSREASPCKCGSDCENRIEDKTARRDVTVIVPILIKQGQLALEENRLLLVANIVEQLEEELARFDDICALWSTNPELIALREALKS